MTRFSIQGILKKTKSLVRNKDAPNHRGKASLVLVIGDHWGHEEASWHNGVTIVVKGDKARGSVVALPRKEGEGREQE